MHAEPEPLAFDGVGGVRIAGDRRGDPSRPPVLFLHGGGQTRHSWGGTAAAVAARGWQALTLDARGHGETDWASDGDYRLVSFAGDVEAVVRSLGEPVVLVGASLGGLTSIMLEGEQHPGTARAVVLVDIIPAMERGGADRIQDFMAEYVTAGFASLEEAADAIAAYNPHRERPRDLSGLERNLRRRDGRWYWHWDPRFLGGIADLPPADMLDVERLDRAVANMAVPILLVRGRMSDLVSEDGARQFLDRFPHVEYVDVSGAGHMVVGDRNDAFTEAVVGFLDRHHI